MAAAEHQKQVKICKNWIKGLLKNCQEEDRKSAKKLLHNDEAALKPHCMTCMNHIQVVPINATNIHTHALLNITQCKKCFDFYHSGEFTTDENGIDLYCRWCGDGGHVFCCSSCKHVFCSKCIKKFSKKVFKDEVNNKQDDWRCFVCNPELLKIARTEHCALLSYISKTLDSKSLDVLMTERDFSCCVRKTRRSMGTPWHTLGKRSQERLASSSTSNKKRRTVANPIAVKTQKSDTNIATTSSAASSTSTTSSSSPSITATPERHAIPSNSSASIPRNSVPSNGDSSFICTQTVGAVIIQRSATTIFKTELEDNIIKQLQLYQGLVNKIISFTKKPGFQAATTVGDVRGLYTDFEAINNYASEQLIASVAAFQESYNKLLTEVEAQDEVEDTVEFFDASNSVIELSDTEEDEPKVSVNIKEPK